MAVVRTLLADDHPVFRHGLAALLDDQPDFEVVATAASADEAVALAESLRPDLAVVDVILPGDGLRAAQLIAERVPETKIVMLTVSEDDTDVFRAIEAGAHGYLLKEIEPDELVDQLRSVCRGEAALSPSIAAKLLRKVRAITAVYTPQGTVGLTQRESEILGLLTAGLSNKEIANRLSITESTVKTHLHTLLVKSGTRNRAELAVWAVRYGLVPRRNGMPTS